MKDSERRYLWWSVLIKQFFYASHPTQRSTRWLFFFSSEIIKNSLSKGSENNHLLAIAATHLPHRENNKKQKAKHTMPNFTDIKEWDALDHFHQKWNVLDGHAREAAAMIGYTQEDWDTGKVTHLLEEKNWNELDAPQQDAAKVLGLTEEKWSRVFTSIHHDTHKPHADPNEEAPMPEE